ncbi:tetratricopeptide repeat protein [[Actinomadura] parvosata]|uniref:tetratricopeptide repeat protein n=1 Tax=[Actinomadura] parvosata TaxID=1955412 RepID=UPI00406D0FB0
MRVLSPDHADLLASFNNLARAYAAVGDLDRAIPLLERTLAGCERVLGAEHPRTREVRDTLASLRRAAAERP